MRWRLAVLAVWLGCYAPAPNPGAPCPDGVCPEGLLCSPATQTCERMAMQPTDAALDDAPIATDDAMFDARVVDGQIADAPPPPPVPMLIQQSNNAIASATTVSATLPAAPVNGRMLVMAGAAVSGSLATVSGGGATWTRATSSLENTNIEVWYGVTDGSSATVTIARPTESSQMFLVVTEWSNLATTSSLDGARSTFGSSTTASSGSITTTNARDLLIFGASAQSPNTYGAPSPGAWTAIPVVMGGGITEGVWYRVVESTGTYSASVTQTAAAWEAAIVALRIAP